MKIEIKYDMSGLGMLVTHIKGLIKDEVDNEQPLDIASWTHEFGIALSVNDAQKIVDFIDGMTDSFTKNELNIPDVSNSLPPTVKYGIRHKYAHFNDFTNG